MQLDKKLIPYLLVSAVLCTSCSSIQTDTDVTDLQSATLEETTTIDSSVTSTDATTSTLATTSDTTTDSSTTTEETTTTIATTTEAVTTTETEAVTQTTTTTEQPSEEVQLTPDEMFDEMFESHGEVHIVYTDESNQVSMNTFDYSEVGEISSALYGSDYIRNYDMNLGNGCRNVSIYVTFSDLYGDLSCKETLTIYDVSSLNLDDGNCRVDVEIYDPDGTMYHSSSESYITNAKDVDRLFYIASEMANQ